MPPSLLSVSLSVTAFSAILLSYARWKNNNDSFPSPPSDFFLGHLRTLNQGIPCITLADYGKKYGKSHVCFLYTKRSLIVP